MAEVRKFNMQNYSPGEFIKSSSMGPSLRGSVWGRIHELNLQFQQVQQVTLLVRDYPFTYIILATSEAEIRFEASQTNSSPDPISKILYTRKGWWNGSSSKMSA
jgi:hypothetical protein